MASKNPFQQFGRKLAKFLSSSWTITLSATMIGVLSAIFLDGYFEESKLQAEKNKAMKEVRRELDNNVEELKDYQAILKSQLEAYTYMFSIINNGMDVILEGKDIREFRERSRAFFSMTDSVLLDDGKYQIKGEMNLDLNSRLSVISLSDVSWKSYKQTNYLSITSFQCLSEVEALYDLQEQVNLLNKEWTRQFFRGDHIRKPEIRADFITTWRNLIFRQDLLLEFYELKQLILKNCSK